jgi:predicted nucleotidyltransferase
MPERSSSTFVRTWPDRSTVDEAARAWAERAQREHDKILAIGYVGSYARGDWGPGSDLDLIVIVRGELPPIGERARTWDTRGIPVPVDLLLYSLREWRASLDRSARWLGIVTHEAVWLYGKEEGMGGGLLISKGWQVGPRH